MRSLVMMVAAVASLASAAGAATAPGAPGKEAFWAYAGKSGIGTAYEPYETGPDGELRAAGRSRVWFSVADGMLTETMFGLIHEAQVKTARIAVQTRAGLVVEGENTTARTEYLYTDKAGRPLAPAFRLVTRDKAGTVEIEKHIFTDPDRNALVMRVIVRPLKGSVTPYLLVEPHMANTATGDLGEAGRSSLSAHEGSDFLTIRTARPMAQASVGFLGVSDGLTRLRTGRGLGATYSTTGDQGGAILLTGQLGRAASRTETFDIVFGFGTTQAASADAAGATLKTGYKAVLDHYEGVGGKVGWSSYLAGLKALPRIAAQAGDDGRLAYASALELKVQEDKTHAGALIASLSNPWGDTVPATVASTGYKAVWPRDFYQCAMALAALGDRQTPVAAFRYLRTIQVKATTPGNSGVTGWFQQKSHVDGAAEWKGVQLDQTAMPIMLGWKLWKMGAIGDAELKARYGDMLKPAAEFLVHGGRVSLLDNQYDVKPLFSQQERWEEQEGYSPSTTAAVITGLAVATEIAEASGDAAGAGLYRQTADQFSARVEALMFTTRGALGDGHYYLRVATGPTPDQPGRIVGRNGLTPITEDRLIDAGFLELVRYGVRRADDPHILASLRLVDDQTRDDDLRVRYDFRFAGDPVAHPGFRRYGHDGYGEDAVTGGNYGADHGRMSSGQRGRVWPIFTGERGHYALALASLSGKPDAKALDEIRAVYVRGMEQFANEGLMLPEQVYEGVGAPTTHGARLGQGTGSATPLSWAHAEYVKLLRSLADGQVFDLYPTVKSRYAP